MTREEKLFSMTMKVLAGEAEKLGVKINKKGKKEDAVKRILDAEAAIAENAAAQAEDDKKYTAGYSVNPLDDEEEEVTEEVTAPETEEVTEEPAPKKERKTRTKNTFESLLANVPVLGRVAIQTNGKKRNAVHIQTENGKRRIFGYDGAVVVVTNEKYLHGVVEITAEKKNYGWRVEPTTENMLAIQRNYIATITK